MPLFTIPKMEWDKKLAGHNLNMKYFMVNGLPRQKCAGFEMDWLRCADGLGQKKAFVECDQEYADFIECGTDAKKRERLLAIRKQRDKLVKEGKYDKNHHPSL
ncbi:NADH dehydrogenase [ubiquinone] iron-sulfur protein 5-like [Saccoglossus kowalevskii]|uniref:NADH dehydrogenase [ubiquinone] iron-sulfur protein 5-like n=1 Tax=Saccoglossus kowalevskii TaxID=10224 RepID=A0ABM0GU66_SACKO|nr:PREDICTED: NADH dehydrogenase [ubiquinone] iron-sulfur protein 5-like [Saccoglossus kowalevskii]